MKKIYYIVSLAVLALFTSCDYNGSNFPGYDQAAIPTNVSNYSYTLTATDYSNISKAALKVATTKADSTFASAINSNKMFKDSLQFITYIPTILNTKYMYADETSSALITFNLAIDTTKIAAANKYTLVNPTDYATMGTATGFPGKSNYFSGDINPDFYIPIWLKDNNYYAKSGDIKLIRYRYSASNVVSQRVTVYIFDGTNWINYNASSKTSAKFKFKSKAWQFSNSEVFVEKFVKDFGTFTPQVVSGTYTWTWGSYNGGCVVGNAYNKGACEIWLVSPVIDLKDRTNPTLSFDHAVNYATGLPYTDLTSAYVSTDYTNDVTKATWQKLSFTYPSNFSFTFLNSGKISLKTYANKKITIAFKYVSTGTALAWEISNINVLDE